MPRSPVNRRACRSRSKRIGLQVCIAGESPAPKITISPSVPSGRGICFADPARWIVCKEPVLRVRRSSQGRLAIPVPGGKTNGSEARRCSGRTPAHYRERAFRGSKAFENPNSGNRAQAPAPLPAKALLRKKNGGKALHQADQKIDGQQHGRKRRRADLSSAPLQCSAENNAGKSPVSSGSSTSDRRRSKMPDKNRDPKDRTKKDA